MGTNYYWHDQACGECGRFERVHVGKSSGGWSFLFHAIRHEDGEWGVKSPFGIAVVGRFDWRTVLTGRPGTLWDEYGKQIEDPIAWLDSLPAPTREQQDKEQEWLGGWRAEAYTRDAEGFRYEYSEFS